MVRAGIMFRPSSLGECLSSVARRRSSARTVEGRAPSPVQAPWAFLPHVSRVSRHGYREPCSAAAQLIPNLLNVEFAVLAFHPREFLFQRANPFRGIFLDFFGRGLFGNESHCRQRTTLAVDRFGEFHPADCAALFHRSAT